MILFALTLPVSFLLAPTWFTLTVPQARELAAVHRGPDVEHRLRGRGLHNMAISAPTEEGRHRHVSAIEKLPQL